MTKKLSSLLLAASFALIAPIDAQTGSKKHKRSSNQTQTSENAGTLAAALAQSANGWTYVKGEWVHPDGYKFVNGKVLRTTAKLGKPAPEPPGKLALENARKLEPKSKPSASETAKTAAEKAAEQRRKNLTPRPASQTGTHL
jgi:hypothetical protein